MSPFTYNSEWRESNHYVCSGKTRPGEEEKWLLGFRRFMGMGSWYSDQALQMLAIIGISFSSSVRGVV
jgi:hypothetical protein